ncbi:glycosyltransferase [Paenibacillus sp. GD4]|uniref:glycosyltransferase n=1 Tax=Paenibacillus sp. GD4 TaxID=3068890 RepID=UPI0027969D17|nr:glycosyltransferase [Paenibacillus sp. GD4]MDQ1911284.1 glycosyltransferase [Paenibacillus sp. GD4]
MMVKNEEKNLNRCLRSLEPVMSAIPSELIIVDTGSTDDTVLIANQYTDKVYFHKWNNHFSEMRNISISYAKGEWIFIIDADEELDAPTDLHKVFEYNEINRFNTIRMQVRNYVFKDEKKEIYNVSERLFRNDGEFHYAGSIHNQPIFKGPVINTDLVINHYGYYNDDPELMERKFKRTSTLLLKELEKDPNSIYYRFQLARSYLMHKDNKEALEEIEKAFELVQKLEESLIKTRYYYVLGEYVRILFFNDKWQECINVSEKGLADNSEYLDLYYYKAASLYYLDKKEEAEAVFVEYFKLLDEYRANKVDLAKFSSIEMYTVDKQAAAVVASHLSDYLYSKERYGESLKYAEYMYESNKKSILFIRNYLKLKRYHELFGFYNAINDKSLLPFFVACMENELKEMEESDVSEVVAVFAGGQDLYSRFNAIRKEKHNTALIRNFIGNYDISVLSSEPYSQVLTYAIEAEINLFPYLKKLSDGNIKTLVKIAIDYSQKSVQYFKNYLQNTRARSNDYHANRLLTAIGNVLFLTAIEKAKASNMPLTAEDLSLSEEYKQAGIHYISSLYQTNGIRMNYKTFDNSEHQFYILLFLAKEAFDSGLQKNAIEYYKGAAEHYPFLAELVKHWIANMMLNASKQLILASMKRDSSQSGNELKVLQGSIEIANQMSLLTEGLKQNEVCARSLTYHPNYLRYYADYELDIHTHTNKDRMVKDLGEITKKAMECFNVFHFHFGTTLTLDHSDLPLLRGAKKAVLMHYWGSEVRMLSVAREWNRYVQVKVSDEDEIKRKLEHLGSMIDHCVVADHELYQYVKGYHKHIHFIKQTIDLEKYMPDPRFKFRKKKPLVVHAPTSPEIKGTKFILQAVEELKSQYDFEFVLVQGKSHDEARQIYQQADIVLDELLCGSYGILAIESMAMGKPVITYINEHIRETYPSELPLVTANPETVKEVLKSLLTDWDQRVHLGKQGRLYVEKHHDARIIAKQFIDLYQTILSDVGAR